MRNTTYTDTPADRNKIKLAVAGGASAAISRTLVAPLSRTTVLFQVGWMRSIELAESYTRGVWSALKTTWQREGFRGYFRGNGTHLLRKVPFAAIKWMSYERYKQHEDARVWRRLLAGGGSALTAVLLTYPLDLIQTNITVQTNNDRRNNSISSTFRRIYGENGVRGLYRGVSLTLLSVIPYIAFNVTLWENLKKMAKNKLDMKGPFISAMCGGLSGAIVSSFTFPMEVVRKHIQLNGGREGKVYRGYLDAIQQIHRTKGMRGFYKGIWPHYLTVTPIVAISFGSYDLFKHMLNVH
ncbi:EF-hand domain-containing protein [Planoprotostelium fungivorum]|uniref:EF-hand domain-containing protein n=1 Tax=Planoprotostelium fungivorum TaxID=1890364 RepID=A0A2P6NW46_9EUKA|nr:EF-hand domain-containing protein [Planoprotostelium fungivorum]